MDHVNLNSGGAAHNGLYGHQGTSNPRPNITRPFTLQESLPYSPQTSTIPFISDIIPDPSLGSGTPALPISDLFHTQEFDSLNKDAYGQAQMPRNVRQAVDHVLQDMKPSQRTHFKFCAVSKRPSTGVAGKSLADDLSPITRAVYDKVGGYFKATKANLSDRKLSNGQAGAHHNQTKRASSSSSLNSPIAPQPHPIPPQNIQTNALNPARIEVAIPSKVHFDGSQYIDVSALTQPEAPSPVFVHPPAQQEAPHLSQPAVFMRQSSVPMQQTAVPLPHYAIALPPPTAPPDANQNSSIRIELPLKHINRDEYLDIEEAPEEPHNLSVRRHDRQGYTDGQEVLGESLDQRQRGEAAFGALEKLMQTVFASVGSVLAMEPGYDHIVTMTQDQEVAMTAATQQKIHTAIQKTIGLKCYDRVPVEHLVRITKLSEASLKQCDGLEMRVDESWSEDVMESWVQKLSEVDTILKAARTCLRILSGGREDKQLYSEAIIQKSVDIFKLVTEDIVMPLVELRPSGNTSNIFKMLSRHKKAITSTFVCCQKLFALLAELVTKIELSDTVINSLEFTASRLIFVENAYFEKDSAVGVQKFDGIRSVAMDMLCQIFLMKPQQRQGIIDEILTSLEKLPVGKQSARQFKLSDGGSIQPVSALLMRLVQASSGRVDSSKERNRNNMMQNIRGEEEGYEEEDGDFASESKQPVSSIKNEAQGAQQHPVSIKDLDTAVTPLTDNAQRNASYVINFIVKRAIGSTKSGDTPYRNLLDLFVEDFTTCLDSPDWPSAELLLRLLMVMMVQLFEAPKTAAPAKNMALELLGGLSAAISRLRSHVKRMASASEGNDADELSRYLADLANHALDQKSHVEQMVAWAGPYRATLEYLQNRCTDDPHLSSAISFVIADWASQVHMGYDSFQEGQDERDQELGRLGYRLRMMVEDRRWLVNEYTFKAVSASQAKLSYSVILLRSPLCESFGKILNILLGSMASDQATVRSKSLKSVNQVLETDPSILDGDSAVIQLILECASDSSTQVRDSALGLLGSCINMRPALETSLTPKIIDRFQDSGVGVRKRAMKLARDIYLRNRMKQLRSAIANGLLRRVQDPDETVRDLARQMIEEVWFAPFYRDEGTAVYQTALTEHVALIIQTVKSGTVTEILDKVFQTILKPQSKSLEGPFSVCSKLVANMFGLIDNLDSDDSAVPSGRDALQVLTIFAKADAKLFNFEQIRLLKPHLASFSGADELVAFRAVTVIYKRVLPQLSAVHSEFLMEVRLQLLKAIGKIGSRGAVDDLIACTRVVCDLLQSFEPLANLVASSLLGIQKLRAGPLDNKKLQFLSAYSIIVGMVGKHCDLDKQIQIFKKKFPKWQGDSVPRLVVDMLVPFALPSQPLDARKASLEAIGLVCQAWPRNYVLAKVYTSFQQVFDDQIPILETMILRSFREFLITEEKRSETAATEGSAKQKKELTVMGGTSFDDVASATTQRFLKDFTRISVSTQDEHAFLAMEVLGSINRQGLTHPKETGVTLITLETSANRKIAELAFAEHRALHEKHETVLEREYAKAVQSAYAYQRDVVGDSHGATMNPFQSKLHFLMEVLKISKMKNRQRFLEKLCGQVDFDLSKLDAAPELPPHVDFSRFIIENLAFFEYQTVGELQTTVNSIEKTVTSTGATVAQAIESEVFNVRMDVDMPVAPAPAPLILDGEPMGLPAPTPAPAMIVSVDPSRLRQLTAGSVILLSMWEARTHLRRLYGMGTHRHDSKAKALAKDLNKIPTKVQGVHGERFWDEVTSHMDGLVSQEQMIQKCKTFVELLNVDKEFKVVDDDEGQMEDPTTPSGEEDDDGDVMADRGRKRKGVMTPGGRKKRARSDSQPRKRGRPRKQSVEHDLDGDLDGDWI
ncbi:sister chromatid cohesion C-terminus-domain-containing protein [Dactylonectria macrodidyma]|uniref:Sister chromatid cohesion protein n=1 Tax=Dactylonectria macrodidyma TaxID=307937 RepID=A0A9P9JGP2_9HYPO|nr:sister chromatid cohesion C-terminus-domain-containing protein [Dactylonectria macrodidyma]